MGLSAQTECIRLEGEMVSRPCINKYITEEIVTLDWKSVKFHNDVHPLMDSELGKHLRRGVGLKLAGVGGHVLLVIDHILIY